MFSRNSEATSFNGPRLRILVQCTCTKKYTTSSGHRGIAWNMVNYALKSHFAIFPILHGFHVAVKD